METYIKFTCENVQIRIWFLEIWKYIVPLCFSNLGFKTFLRLEVGMRFKALRNERRTTCCYAEIYQWLKLWLLHNIIEWKFTHYFACGLETPLGTTEGNLTHTWIMVIMRLELKSFRLQDGNVTVLVSVNALTGSECKSQHYHRKNINC